MKKKTAEYLMRAEQIASQHLRSDMGQGSTQTVVIQITNFLLILTTLLIFNINLVDLIISDLIACVPQGFRGAVLRIQRQGELSGSVGRAESIQGAGRHR